MSETTTIAVDGMTCRHCAASVREEISEIAGVTDVAVDVDSGRVDITSDAALDPSAVGAAVTEAGYTVR
ncbi:heavy-metal-associated domain-containing protein [Gordonia sp. HY442]|uniref:heavy-metal-associated domain-containing protein n=1 Tax=Gordonia zhenghanii TaxID=2911516 RepID=UPI001F3C28EE|nr:heavy metal-associated domain-containing protein [Gordonia zhenghanii]MCF8604469.1 heavy-metal-associated domain-containing protein [Gordonia zhenghanii]